MSSHRCGPLAVALASSLVVAANGVVSSGAAVARADDAAPASAFADRPAAEATAEFEVECDGCGCRFEASALVAGRGRLWTIGKDDRLFHMGLPALERALERSLDGTASGGRERVRFDALPLTFAPSVAERPVHRCGGGWESLAFGSAGGRPALLLSHEAPSRAGPACIAPARCEGHRLFAAAVGAGVAAGDPPTFEPLVEHVDLAPYSAADRCNSSWEALQWLPGRGLVVVAEASAPGVRALVVSPADASVRPIELPDHRLRVSAAAAVPNTTDELILASYCWHGDRIGCAKDGERSALTVSRWRVGDDRIDPVAAPRLLADARTFNAEGAAVVELGGVNYLALVNDNRPSDDDCSPTRLRLYALDSLFDEPQR